MYQPISEIDMRGKKKENQIILGNVPCGVSGQTLIALSSKQNDRLYFFFSNGESK